MTVTIIFIIAISVAATIGAVIGIFKKATNLSFWGATTLLGVLVSWLIAKFVAKESSLYSYLILGVTIGAVVLIMGIFGGLKKFLKKRVANAREYSHYKNADKVEENEAYVMDAVDKKDKRAYRKLRRKRRKIKDRAGGWGAVDRLLGLIAGGLDWLVAVGCIICTLLLFVEFSGIGVLQDNDIVKELLASEAWVNLGAKFSLDMLLIGTLVITIKSGFKKGIFYLIPKIVVLALLVGFGYASWTIADSSLCSGIVSGMQDGILVPIRDLNADAATIVAKVIITVVLFLLSLIIVIVVGITLSKLMDKFRDNDAFYVIDGVFGVILSVGVLLAALLAVGGIAYTLNDLAFMEKFNLYEEQSVFANGFYKYNPLGELFANLPLRGWLEPKAAEH